MSMKSIVNRVARKLRKEIVEEFTIDSKMLYKVINRTPKLFKVIHNLIKEKNKSINYKSFVNYKYPTVSMIHIEKEINRLYDKLEKGIKIENLDSIFKMEDIITKEIKSRKDIIKTLASFTISTFNKDDIEDILNQKNRKKIFKKYGVDDIYINSMVDSINMRDIKNIERVSTSDMVKNLKPSYINLYKEVITYSELSNMVYYKNILKDDYKKHIKNIYGMEIVDDYGIRDRSKSGLSFVLLKNRYGYYSIVVRGTDITDINDIREDINIAAGKIPFRQLTELCDYIDKMIKSGLISNSSRLTIAGHSLGGALAQLVSTIYMDKLYVTYTFNSPGMRKCDIKIDKVGSNYYYNSRKLESRNDYKRLLKIYKNRDSMVLNSKVLNIGVYKNNKPDFVFNIGEHIGSRYLIHSSIIYDLLSLKDKIFTHNIDVLIKKLNIMKEIQKYDDTIKEHDILSIFSNPNNDISKIIEYFKNSTHYYKYEINLKFLSKRYNVSIDKLKEDNRDLFENSVEANYDKVYIYSNKSNCEIKLNDKLYDIKEIEREYLLMYRYPFVYSRQLSYLYDMKERVNELKDTINREIDSIYSLSI